MLNYEDWILDRQDKIARPKLKIKSFSCKDGSKEVRVSYKRGRTVFIDWYIDNMLVKHPSFPIYIMNESIIPNLKSFMFKNIDDNLLKVAAKTLGKYLPYLKDSDKPENYNNWTNYNSWTNYDNWAITDGWTINITAERP